MDSVPVIAPEVFHLEIVIKLIQLCRVDAGPKSAPPGLDNERFLFHGRQFTEAQPSSDGFVHDLLEILVFGPGEFLEPPCQIVLEGQRSSHMSILMPITEDVKMSYLKLLLRSRLAEAVQVARQLGVGTDEAP